MPRSGRKQVTAGSPNAWQSTLDKLEDSEPSQAGEPLAEDLEGRSRGASATDQPEGGGGYGGDAAEFGEESALAEPERPTDAEIHGDPRTPQGSAYPDDAKRSHEQQHALRREDAAETDEDDE